jgi:hypothetical protein
MSKFSKNFVETVCVPGRILSIVAPSPSTVVIIRCLLVFAWVPTVYRSAASWSTCVSTNRSGARILIVATISVNVDAIAGTAVTFFRIKVWTGKRVTAKIPASVIVIRKGCIMKKLRIPARARINKRKCS